MCCNNISGVHRYSTSLLHTEIAPLLLVAIFVFGTELIYCSLKFLNACMCCITRQREYFFFHWYVNYLFLFLFKLLMSDIYQEAGLPLWLRPYEVIVTSAYTALIETIPDTVGTFLLNYHHYYFLIFIYV